MNLASYLKKIVTGSLSLVQGLVVTSRWFAHPKGIVTEQYPENRKTLVMHPRFRGEVIMPHDEAGEHKCTGCSLCEKSCPNGSISVLNTKNQAGRKVLGKFIYRLDTCTLCNLCVEACPFDAIHMGNGYELSATSRDAFTKVLNKKEGRG